MRSIHFRLFRSISFPTHFNPGFWIVSESEDDSELRSYDSAEYESEEIDSDEAEEDVDIEEEVEIEEEEGDEFEESENDFEVMKILAEEIQKQSQIEKRSEPIKIDRNEKIEATTANNSSNVNSVNVVESTDRKVCMSERKS